MNGWHSHPRRGCVALPLIAALALLAPAGCSDPTAGTVAIGADREAVNQQILNPGTEAESPAGGAASERPGVDSKVAMPGGKSVAP